MHLPDIICINNLSTPGLRHSPLKLEAELRRTGILMQRFPTTTPMSVGNNQDVAAGLKRIHKSITVVLMEPSRQGGAPEVLGVDVRDEIVGNATVLMVRASSCSNCLHAASVTHRPFTPRMPVTAPGHILLRGVLP